MYSRRTRRIVSGSLRFSQCSMASDQVGFTRLREVPMIVAPAFSCSSRASAPLRWSLHMMAGRTGRSSASVSTGIWAPPEKPMPATSVGEMRAAFSAAGTAWQRAAYHSSGFCSDQPYLGLLVATGWDASPASDPSPRISVAFRLPAPRSMPSRCAARVIQSDPQGDRGDLSQSDTATPRHNCWRRHVCCGNFQPCAWTGAACGGVTMSTTQLAAQLDQSLVGARVPLDQIPVIDFGPFLKGSPAERKAVARKIAEACRNIGFFYLTGHGIPAAMVEGVFAEAKRFFAQPSDAKQKIAIEKSACHRGYFALGGENLDPEKQRETGDFKEGLKIGRDLSPDHPLVKAGTPLHGPNQWPDNLPGWKAVMQGYYDALVKLGREIMHAFALALELPETHFDRWLTGPMATLGPLHYPPQQG